jgi:hypothetical protein
LELSNNPPDHPFYLAAQFHPEFKSRWGLRGVQEQGELGWGLSCELRRVEEQLGVATVEVQVGVKEKGCNSADWEAVSCI